MVKKAKAGYVTGGRKFGYDNVEILGPNGERNHVDRRINPIEAVVLDIFTLADQGSGLRHIAHGLNKRKAPTPPAHQGRRAGWSPSTVRDVLHSPLYRGADRVGPDGEAGRLGPAADPGKYPPSPAG